MPDPQPSYRRRYLDFIANANAPVAPAASVVRFYVNDDNDLVRVLSNGTETAIGSSAIGDHEEAADPHSQYLTADP
jgi:hypothetical protein